MEESPKVIYSSYTEAQKRATQKYREANKEKVNEQRKKYYEARKQKDPDFLQYKRDKAKEYYLKKKNVAKLEVPEAPEYIELVRIDEPEEREEHQETIEEHWHKKAIARDQEPEEEKPPLAWSQTEVKPVKKERKTRASKKAKDVSPPSGWTKSTSVSESDSVELIVIEKKPNLTLDDLNTLLLSDIKEPKTPKSKRSKKEVKEVLLSV